MNKAKLNYLVDVLLFISFILVSLTGIFKFPKLTRYFLGVYKLIPVKLMTILHDWSGIAMILLVGIHLTLHWNWIVAMTKLIFKNEKTNKNR